MGHGPNWDGTGPPGSVYAQDYAPSSSMPKAKINVAFTYHKALNWKALEFRRSKFEINQLLHAFIDMHFQFCCMCRVQSLKSKRWIIKYINCSLTKARRNTLIERSRIILILWIFLFIYANTYFFPWYLGFICIYGSCNYYFLKQYCRKCRLRTIQKQWWEYKWGAEIRGREDMQEYWSRKGNWSRSW